MEIAAAPPGDVPVPVAVTRLAQGRPVRPVWRNELGGLTFEVGAGPDRWFVKWAPAGSGLDLSREADRLAWAAPFVTVPRILGRGAEDGGTWLMTAGLPGRNAVDPRWTADPRPAVVAIGQGLRRLHDALPVETCPFSWEAEHRVAIAHRLAETGRQDRARWHRDHAGLTVPEAMRRIARIPPVDRLVVCHGDACAPNTLLDDHGRYSGHVDLGSLGVADRWADLAVATWSLDWNYGPGWAEHLLAAYGVAPDPVRTAYYRLLWDLGP